MFYSSEDVASARQQLGDLWPLLSPGLWHSTTPTRYRAILDDGEIKPDGGRGGNVYKGSLAVSIGAVSLFDFESASEEDALGTYGKWCTGMIAVSPCGFERLPIGPAALPHLDELAERCPDDPHAELVRILNAARNRLAKRNW